MDSLSIRPAVFALFVIAGCGRDLPPGWEDATLVEDFTQLECSGSPYEEYETVLAAEAEAGGGLRVSWSNAHYRCAQDLEAFWKASATGVEILVQPKDMNPMTVAGCDCLYELSMGVPAPADRGTVTVFRRLDALNPPNDPVRVGEAAF